MLNKILFNEIQIAEKLIYLIINLKIYVSKCKISLIFWVGCKIFYIYHSKIKFKMIVNFTFKNYDNNKTSMVQKVMSMHNTAMPHLPRTHLSLGILEYSSKAFCTCC